jgi:O-antigen/teichoic acid export membrane protein
VGVAVQRFVAVLRGGASVRGIATLFWTALAVYSAVGIAALAIVYAAAPWFMGLFDVPAALEDDGVTMLRLVGVAILLALLASMTGNIQQGLEQFPAFALSAVAGVAAFLAGVAVLVPSEGLVGLGYAAIGQQVVVVVLRLAGIAAFTLAHRPRLLARGDARQLVSFAVQMQMSALSTLVNNQTDKVVVGLIAPVTTVGQVGIGSQVAEAGRVVAGAAINPIVSRMSVVHGEKDAPRLTALYERAHRLWTITVVGGIVLGVASLYPLVAAWLGEGHGDAALFGALLSTAFGINLLTGVPFAYLRAVGRPQLEARYGLTVIALNLVFTIALAITTGPVGVVAATTAAYALGTGWFFQRLGRIAPELPPGTLAQAARALPVAAPLGAVSLGFGIAMIELLPAGIALVPVAAITTGCFVLYMSWMTGVRPSAAVARELVG